MVVHGVLMTAENMRLLDAKVAKCTKHLTRSPLVNRFEIFSRTKVNRKGDLVITLHLTQPKEEETIDRSGVVLDHLRVRKSQYRIIGPEALC